MVNCRRAGIVNSRRASTGRPAAYNDHTVEALLSFAVFAIGLGHVLVFLFRSLLHWLLEMRGEWLEFLTKWHEMTEQKKTDKGNQHASAALHPAC